MRGNLCCVDYVIRIRDCTAKGTKKLFNSVLDLSYGTSDMTIFCDTILTKNAVSNTNNAILHFIIISNKRNSF